MGRKPKKSAAKRSTKPSIPPTTKSKEDEDDVVCIEAVNSSNEGDLVEGHLTESSDESATEAVAQPSVIGRSAANRKRKLETSVRKDPPSLDKRGFTRTHLESSKTSTPSATVQADESPPPSKSRKQFPAISIIEEAGASRLYEESVPSTSSGFRGNGPNRIVHENRKKAGAVDVHPKSSVLRNNKMQQIREALLINNKKQQMKEALLINNKKQQMKEADDDDSVFQFSDDDSVSSAECLFQSIEIWKKMYGAITIGRRRANRRIQFKKDLTMERRKFPPNREFSQELLDSLYGDLKYDVTISGQLILSDLALIHYFICRPGDIKICGGIKVFQKIKHLDWEILRGQDASTLQRRFNGYVRGYIDGFGLPKSILDQFLYWEWYRSLKR